jgi:hypothetical protein
MLNQGKDKAKKISFYCGCLLKANFAAALFSKLSLLPGTSNPHPARSLPAGKLSNKLARPVTGWKD